MFRIKTDIRQYKCETKDKVEKLIRNWVIRPSDLIYNRDEREWLPIGEHPSFVNLFGMLAEQEKNTPDTVVTARSPYADRPPADDDSDAESSPVGPGNVISEATSEDADAPQEVTHIVQRPTVDADEDDEVADVDEEEEEAKQDEEEEEEEEEESDPEIEDADDARSDGDKQLPEAVDEAVSPERETDEVDAQSRDDVDDVEEKSDVGDADSDVSEASEPSDEADEDDEDDEEEQDGEEGEPDARETDVFEQEDIAESLASHPAPPVAPEGVEPPSSNDEVTMMTEKTLDMLKVTDEEEAPDDEDEEATGVRERETVDGDEDDEETTNVVPSPLLDEDEDEEDEPEEDAGAASEEEDEEDGEEEASTKPAEAKGPKLGRHDLPEELFATNEISSPEVQESLKTIDDLGELSEPSTPEEATDDGATPRWGARLDEDSAVEEAWDVIASDLGPGSEAEEALRTTDELDREDSEVEVEVEEWDEDEWEEEGWEGDTPEPAVVQDRDFVSEGYKMPLPFPMRPTADDVRKGLKLTRVARSRRDKAFPLPQPKRPYEVQRRRFDLTPKPPRDQTILLIAGIVMFIAVIAVLVSSC